MDSNGKYTVKRGDTLSEIVRDHMSTLTSAYGITTIKAGVDKLADLNNIKNPDLIYVGQVLIIIGEKKAAKANNTYTPRVDAFGLLANTDRTVFATWTFSKSNLKEYEINWEYYVKANKKWLIGDHSTISDSQSTYNAPEYASQVRFKVKPVSKTYTDSKNKEKSYWTGKWSTSKSYDFKNNPPKQPAVPSVEIDKCVLTARVDNLDVNASEIQFNIVKNDSKTFETVTVKITTTSASYTCTVDTGAKYKVRCRAKRGTLYSEWSEYSANVSSIPAPPKGITVCQTKTKTSIYLEWNKVSTAKTYDICYTTKAEYFDYPDQVTTVNGIETNSYEKTGLETGEQYFFKVRTVDEKNQPSEWSDYKSVILGSKPEAPTTWSSTTTVMTDESLTLYWVHNTEDGSSQTWAELELISDGDTTVLEIKNSTDEDEKDKTSSYAIDMSQYPAGTKLQWRVRTAGILTTAANEPEYGEWSIQRTVDIYAPVTLGLEVTSSNGDEFDMLMSYPFRVSAEAGPVTQTAISYYVEIISNIIYETIDTVGNIKMVNEGEIVYSEHFDNPPEFNELHISLSAGNVELENNSEYTLRCTVTMDSGLTASASKVFTVGWDDFEYEPNAVIDIDTDTYTATIRPFCEGDSGSLVDDVTLSVYRREFDGTFTELATGIQNSVYVERGILSDVDIEFAANSSHIIEMAPLIEGAPYTVYWNNTTYNCTARAFDTSSTLRVVYIGNPALDTENLVDGSSTNEPFFIYSWYSHSGSAYADQVVFRNDGTAETVTLRMTSESNDNITFITDPHPALDYARYRVVAISSTTGAVTYSDIPAQPVGGNAIIIQWDEAWSNFDANDELDDESDRPYWAGSMLKLPYNVDVADGHSPDVELVEYIGREHPVSYYGTQRGVTSTWNFVVPKDDEETLYGLRRLARWMGDVYVREPSGSGYWANVSVSWSQKHLDVIIPVTLNVARVEGGV